MRLVKIIYGLTVCLIISAHAYAADPFDKTMRIKLKPALLPAQNLQALLEKRASCRSFKGQKIKLDDIAAILWAACGKKFDAQSGASRTIPSAGATHPLELYLVAGTDSVDTLAAGIYHYLIEEHALESVILEEDRRVQLAHACFDQNFVAQAPVSLVIVAKPSRTASRYGPRADRYISMEAGSAAQNIYLAATAIGLGTVEVGAFNDAQVNDTLSLHRDSLALSVMPIGYAEAWGR